MMWWVFVALFTTIWAASFSAIASSASGSSDDVDPVEAALLWVEGVRAREAGTGGEVDDAAQEP